MQSSTASVKWEHLGLLSEDKGFSIPDPPKSNEKYRIDINPQASRRPLSVFTCIALWLSVLLNCLLVTAFLSINHTAQSCISEYTGLGLSTQRTYSSRTDYVDDNRTISDALWEAIDTSPNTIALDKDYIQKHGLVDSIPFPWDQSKGLYLIKAFHHMHCLKNIRKAYLDALESHPGQEQIIPTEHIMHCVDGLRQDIMCRPDDTPMPSIQLRHRWGDGQTHKCRDWDALVEWTRHPQRHACFKMLSDYRRVPHSLEQFAFCLEGSPYTEIMENYFQEHGHKDPFLDEHAPSSTPTGGSDY